MAFGIRKLYYYTCVLRSSQCVSEFPPPYQKKVLVFYAKIDFALVIILRSGPGQYVNLFHAAGYGG